MYDNLKPECPWTMSKTNSIKPLYLVKTVYISSLQTLYKLLCDNKLYVIVLPLIIYVQIYVIHSV